MKFRELLIPTLILLSSYTGANALNNTEALAVDKIYEALIENPVIFSNISSATSAINDAITQINDNTNIINNEKNNAILLILLRLKRVISDGSTLNSAIIASIASADIKAKAMNITKYTPDGAKPIANSPS